MGEPLPGDGVIALRPWSEADAVELAACLDGDEEIARWLDRIPQPYTMADALDFFQGTGETTFAIVDAGGGGVLGGIGLRWNEDVAEIGYWARKEARGRGVTHWNPRLGRRQSWVIYSVLPGELTS